MKTFQQFQEAAFAIPAAAGVASKVLPAAAATIGAIGTMMQIKKRVPKDKSKTADIAREMGLDLTDPKQRMKANSLVRRNQMKNKKNNPDGIKNIRKEETTAAPTNSVGDGSNVSLPPSYVPGMRKRKNYANGGRNSRKPWLDHLKNK